MFNTKQRIFLWAYITCVFNFAALIFYSFELLDPEGVIELFVFVTAVSAGSLVFDLHRYNKR